MTNHRRSVMSRVCSLSVLAVCASLPALAQDTDGTAVGDVGGLAADDLARVLPDRPAYSPAVNRNFPTRPLFGDNPPAHRRLRSTPARQAPG